MSLLEHLRKEDEEFYPVLRKAAGHNVKLIEVSEVFATDLKRSLDLCLDFLIDMTKGF